MFPEMLVSSISFIFINYFKNLYILFVYLFNFSYFHFVEIFVYNYIIKTIINLILNNRFNVIIQ